MRSSTRPPESEARAAFFKVKEQWGRLFPSAVQVIEKDLDSLLTFFQFDPTYWTVLRTTNPIERPNKEFKRRTRAMEVAAGEISTYPCLVFRHYFLFNHIYAQIAPPPSVRRPNRSRSPLPLPPTGKPNHHSNPIAWCRGFVQTAVSKARRRRSRAPQGYSTGALPIQH